MSHHERPRLGRRPASPLASTISPLRGLPAAGAWLWLAAPAAIEAVVIAALVLLHVLPGLLVALGAQVGRHG